MAYKIARIGFSFLFGAFVASLFEPALIFWVGSVALVFGLILLLADKKYDLFKLFIISTAIGMLISGIYIRFVYEPTKALDKHSAEIIGTVTDIFSYGGNESLVVETESIDIEKAPQKVTIRLSTWGDDYIPVNSKIKCSVVFSAYTNEKFIGFFEDRSGGVSIYAYAESKISVIGEGEKGFSYYVAALRDLLSKKISMLFSEHNAAMMKRLLLGVRSSSPDYEVSTTFRKAGMSHILVVSGLHLSIIINLFEQVFGVYRAKGKMRYLLTVLIIGIIILYMALAGFGLSIRRAGFMLIISYIARLVREKSVPPDNLGFAVMTVVLVNPMSSCDAGFLMSVLSTFAILAYQKKFLRWEMSLLQIENGFWKRVYKTTADALSVTLLAWLITLPVVVIAYGAVSIVSPISNLLGSFWAETAIFFGMISLILSFFMPLARLIAKVAAASLSVLMNVTEIFADVPGTYLLADDNWVQIWLFGSALLFALPFIKPKKTKYIKYSAVLSTIALLVGILCNQILFSGTSSIKISALSEGTAISCSKGGQTLLLTRGYKSYDTLRLPISKADSLVSLSGKSEATEIALYRSTEPKIALSDNRFSAEYGDFLLIDGGTLNFCEGGSVRIIENSAVEIELGEILVLYIFENCDIMKIEPKFRRADIVIFDGVSPKDFSAIRSRFMVFCDVSGYYSGTSELLLLDGGEITFTARGKNIRKGWDFF